MNGYTPPADWQRTAIKVPPAGSNAFSVQQLTKAVVRRWRTACGICLLVFVAGMMILFNLTPRYTAEALLLIEPRTPNEVGPGPGFGLAMAVDTAKIASLATVIQSNEILEPVVKSEKLYDDPEFGLTGPGRLARLLSFLPGHRFADQPADLQERIDTAVARLQRATSVTREAFTYIVSVNVSSSNPVRAARLAQAISESYINDQLQANREAARRDVAWLTDRIGEVRKEVFRSEEAVADIRRIYGLTPIDAGGTATVASQRISELNVAIGAAETELSRKQAKIEQARRVRQSGGDFGGLPDVMASGVITSLRAQQSEIARKLAEMQPLPSQRDIVANRPDAIRAEEARRAIDGQISAEVNRIIANLENDYAASRNHVEALKAELAKLTGAGSAGKVDGQAKLQEAQSVATANRQVYDSLLNKLKELEQTETKQVPEARIIEKARAPDKPSFPNRALFIFASLGVGAMLGLGGAFAAEHFSADRMRSSAFVVPTQVEQALCLPMLASVPLLTAGDSKQPGSELDFLGYLLANRTSHFAEALRSVRFGLLHSDGDRLGKVIQITSAVPGEGKSILASTLALSTALSGARVLLIDCDFRHPTASKLFCLVKSPGFGDLLSSRAEWNEITHNYPHSSLTVVGAGHCDQSAFDLVGSSRMAEVLKFASENYDVVFLDGPPVLPVSDAALIAKIADKTMLLIEWNKTDRDLVCRAVDSINLNKGTLAGVVLNKVNMDAIKTYGGNYSKYYSNIESYYERDVA
jgi:succinoglycan biosynthesis transport protein ExoP